MTRVAVSVTLAEVCVLAAPTIAQGKPKKYDFRKPVEQWVG